MNNNIRLGLFAVSAIAVLSLAACKTTDDMSQENAPAAEAAPAPMPADSSMPTNATSTTPTDTSTTPPTTP